MSKYSLYQIRLSDELVNQVNAVKDGNYPAAYLNYLDALCHGNTSKAIIAGQYSKVAEIEAKSLDGVFHIGNVGPEEKITRLADMHSVSVGDIIGDPAGKFHVVASFGFNEIKEDLSVLPSFKN